MSDSDIKEKFVIARQLKMSLRFPWRDNISFIKGNVPGRVLDIIEAEICLHFPELRNNPQLKILVRNIPKRLARPESFDFDKSMAADEHWNTGMFENKDKQNV